MTEPAGPSPVSEPLVRFDGLSVRYPGHAEPSVIGVDLTVAASERVGVTGPSGAGLSTLALVAGGLVPRVVRASLDGQARIVGVDAATATADDLLGRAGIVFSTPANQLSGSKPTVREELAFGLENLGVPRAEMDARIGAVLDRLGIADLADRDPFSLSGGEQQRVAIASIVVMGTSLLVLDEPVAQLDPAGAAIVGQLVAELAAGGTGVLATERTTGWLTPFDRVLELPRRGPAEAARPWTAVRDRAAVTVDLGGVSHAYRDQAVAIHDIDLRIEPGERIAIVGRNGSGKTTLVKHLVGLLRPATGEVRLDGAPIADAPIAQLAATVGFVFQHPDDQLFERTIEREVRFGPRNLGIDAATTDRLVEVALGATGLAERRAMNPYDLGLAGRKLVALASVLAMDPAVLVLDEPTLGQDAEGVERIRTLTRALADAGRSVVAVTHDLALAATGFDRVVVLGDGTIIDDGPPERVLAPSNEAVLASTGLIAPTSA
jgi:energy-coupling factor transport system ATP-binding protein